MKVWCVPVNLPDAEKEPEQAEAAARFFRQMKGLLGVCPMPEGRACIVFDRIENARAAKWKLEEFSEIGLHIIEGTLTDDGKKLNCNKVLKGE